MASTTLLLLFLSLILSLSSTSSSSHPSNTILDAAEILSSTSGFDVMALNLELASQTLAPPQTRSLTIFAPTDVAFSEISHLPLSLLRYHLLPHAFSLHSLGALPFGAKIATLLPGHSLTVTTTSSHARHRHISINNVTVHASPLFHNRHLVIFGIERFFDPYLEIPAQIRNFHANEASTCFQATMSFSSGQAFPFEEASNVLRSRGCSVMASILDLQFVGLRDRDRPQLTLFAPIDEVIAGQVENVSDYSFILRNHLVPCKVSWSDLVSLDDGTLISTYERGFSLKVTKPSGDTVLLNGVPVVFPELYQSDWLVVHGLRDVLSDSKNGYESSSLEVHHHGTEHYHFSVFH